MQETLFNTIAGENAWENAGELRTTSGGNNSKMIMALANFTQRNSTPPQWYTEHRNPLDYWNGSTSLMLVYDFRQISGSEMIIDVGMYVAYPFFNGFEYKKLDVDAMSASIGILMKCNYLGSVILIIQTGG